MPPILILDISSIAIVKIPRDPENAVEKFLHPLVEKYGLKSKSLVSFPGKIPERWAKLDGQKETIKPDKAKEWAKEIARQVQSK